MYLNILFSKFKMSHLIRFIGIVLAGVISYILIQLQSLTIELNWLRRFVMKQSVAISDLKTEHEEIKNEPTTVDDVNREPEFFPDDAVIHINPLLPATNDPRFMFEIIQPEKDELFNIDDAKQSVCSDEMESNPNETTFNQILPIEQIPAVEPNFDTRHESEFTSELDVKTCDTPPTTPLSTVRVATTSELSCTAEEHHTTPDDADYQLAPETTTQPESLPEGVDDINVVELRPTLPYLTPGTHEMDNTVATPASTVISLQPEPLSKTRSKRHTKKMTDKKEKLSPEIEVYISSEPTETLEKKSRRKQPS